MGFQIPLYGLPRAFQSLLKYTLYRCLVLTSSPGHPGMSLKAISDEPGEVVKTSITIAKWYMPSFLKLICATVEPLYSGGRYWGMGFCPL